MQKLQHPQRRAGNIHHEPRRKVASSQKKSADVVRSFRVHEHSDVLPAYLVGSVAQVATGRAPADVAGACLVGLVPVIGSIFVNRLIVGVV